MGASELELVKAAREAFRTDEGRRILRPLLLAEKCSSVAELARREPAKLVMALDAIDDLRYMDDEDARLQFSMAPPDAGEDDEDQAD